MSGEAPNELLRSLPKVEEVLHAPLIEALLVSFPRSLVVEAVRITIDKLRQQILAKKPCDTSINRVARIASERARALTSPSLRRVINASGVIVHTNLGRSVLAPCAVKAVNEVACGYSTLEYDVSTQVRGSRHAHCEQLICALTGAEAAIAVNNNAAAVMMILSEFAGEHEAVVSRGELVEIGGSFRIPDIMALSHAAMREVGTTNKTHVTDYAQAIGPNTTMLLKVHPSNYRLIGFTETVSVKELRMLADAENAQRATGEALTTTESHEVLVYEDQGSGAFLRLDSFGAWAEPTVTESLRAGCDLVSFSGDKLLGGPQAGIIVGTKHHIDRLKSSPLARVLRLDKMTIAALEATLRLYLDPERACAEIPTLRMLTEPAETVRKRAEMLLHALQNALPLGCAELDVIEEVARAGGGALPMCDIPSFAVRVTYLHGDALSCERYLVTQREIPVVARIKKEALLFDARTILNEDEIGEIAQALCAYFTSLNSDK